MSIFNQFQCRVETFRIHTLDAGARIKPHIDSGYSLEQGKVRLHIPIQTNSDVNIFILDKPVSMKEGECWYCDFNKIHEVQNNSDLPRVHLILDCIVNEWLEDIFKQVVLVES